MSSGSALAVDLGSPTANDAVVVKGGATVAGSVAVRTLDGYAPDADAGPWTILTATGAVSGVIVSTTVGYVARVDGHAVLLCRSIRAGVLTVR
jgi:hypothetical protein